MKNRRRAGGAPGTGLRKKIGRKLRSRAGESIAETLVALLISALALIMLAEAMSASSGIIQRSREKLAKYYDGQEQLVRDPSSYSESGNVLIKGLSDEASDLSYPVKYKPNPEFVGTPVVDYVYNPSGS